MGLSALPGLEYFFSHIREVFNYNLFKYFLRPFVFLSFWDPYNSNVGAFKVVPEVSETVLNSFRYLFCSAVVISTILSSRLLSHFSVSVILLLIPSREFLISFIVLFITVCLLFSSSRSFLNVSSIFPFSFQDFRSLLSLL